MWHWLRRKKEKNTHVNMSVRRKIEKRWSSRIFGSSGFDMRQGHKADKNHQNEALTLWNFPKQWIWMEDEESRVDILTDTRLSH